MNKSYFAIIPASVRYDKRLTANAKLLYGEITALCNEKGYCWARNSYFAELYGVSKTSISKWISQLIEYGHIFAEIKYKGNTKEVEYRYLKLVDTPINDSSIPIEEKLKGGIEEKLKGGIEEKLKDNNTVINNTILNNTNNNINAPSDKIEQEPIEKTFIEIPLNDNTNYQFSVSLLEEYKQLYPAADVEQELRNYKAWAIANPKKRKTRRGILSSINFWLSKEQDRGKGLKSNQKDSNTSYDIDQYEKTKYQDPQDMWAQVTY